MERLHRLLQSDPLNKIPAKSLGNVRFLTFNINGSKTLFKYHPWNALQNSYDDFLLCLDADIVSLQELKVQLDALTQLGLLKKYTCFVSVPKSKKGYSGVALYVRKPTDRDSNRLRQFLTVVKAEEGVTGRLPSGDSLKTPYFLLPSQQSIGGYLEDADLQELAIDEEYMQSLDSEGRCVVVELANNVVVFSLYCPANSMGTEDGEMFRLLFLEVLLRRCRNLKQMGKEVVIMGDINVSMDLIDNAEGINVRIKQKKVINNLSEGPAAFELTNSTECLEFRTSAPQRLLLNAYTHPTLQGAPTAPTQFLYDTTRVVQKRRMAIYSVWNTMTNARQSNYGSRIDLILVSCPQMAQNLVKSDILPYLHGSDHCPVFTDIDTAYQEEAKIPLAVKLPFEARTFYKLVVHRDISSMFGAWKKEEKAERALDNPEIRNLDIEMFELKTSDLNNFDLKLLEEPKSILSTPEPRAKAEIKRIKLEYSSRKKTDSQQLIKNFFFKDRDNSTSKKTDEPPPKPTNAVKLHSISGFASMVYNDPPTCRHGEPCCLKTSLTKESKGKKFWCCARTSKGSSGTIGEHRCEFFEWARVNRAK
ncbi:CIC11C00000005651 [Sungouiella intermedia]|uniref:DNA-(apurinic or apyrimidinic site) endonuclease 2 n=1 Tax=Sungouiella intermedia TaxID=45354 RepID=A0A1L0DZ66_9ASCO|nr:CIC11C00000005651 [[Candida] intermedia]